LERESEDLKQSLKEVQLQLQENNTRLQETQTLLSALKQVAVNMIEYTSEVEALIESSVDECRQLEEQVKINR
jgi:methyl-accepting chemotaxis protein